MTKLEIKIKLKLQRLERISGNRSSLERISGNRSTSHCNDKQVKDFFISESMGLESMVFVIAENVCEVVNKNIIPHRCDAGGVLQKKIDEKKVDRARSSMAKYALTISWEHHTPSSKVFVFRRQRGRLRFAG